jgi:hypothetical protein
MMSVARELFAIADDLREKAKAGASYDANQLSELVDFLTPLARLAHNQEEELSVFRLVEAGTVGRTVVNDLATEALGNLMIGETKVIHADFGRKG